MFSPSKLAVFATLVSVVLATDCTRNYTVVEGDYCDKISAANNASTYQLAAVNPSIDAGCDNLMPGEVLCLGTEGDDCTSTYVVQSDDTCDGINSVFGINNTILYENNPQINQDCSNIYVGEVLCVANTVLAPPIPANFNPDSVTPAAAVSASDSDDDDDDDSDDSTDSSDDSSDDSSPDDGDDDIPWDQLPFCEDDD